MRKFFYIIDKRGTRIASIVMCRVTRDVIIRGGGGGGKVSSNDKELILEVKKNDLRKFITKVNDWRN